MVKIALKNISYLKLDSKGVVRWTGNVEFDLLVVVNWSKGFFKQILKITNNQLIKASRVYTVSFLEVAMMLLQVYASSLKFGGINHYQKYFSQPIKWGNLMIILLLKFNNLPLKV